MTKPLTVVCEGLYHHFLCSDRKGYRLFSLLGKRMLQNHEFKLFLLKKFDVHAR